MFLLLAGCAARQPEAPAAAPRATVAPPAETRFVVPGKVGILPFAGLFGERVADWIGQSMEECGMEVVPRRRPARQDDLGSAPVDSVAEQERWAGWVEQPDIRLFLEGAIVVEGEPEDKYTRLMVDVRLVDGHTTKVVWSHRAAFWSYAGSSRSSDLNRAARQIGGLICGELGAP